MRNMVYGTLAAAGFFVIAAMGHPVLANPPGDASRVMLAQTTQTPGPAAPSAAHAQQQPAGAATTMPGHMMEPGKTMGSGTTMGPGQGPMMGGQAHPGPMGGMPPCPAGKTMSGTPPACK